MKISTTLSLIICLISFGTVNAQTPELWGMTSQGGVDDIGVVFKINGDGTGYWKVHDFEIKNPGGYPRRSRLIQYSDGKLYGMTSFGGKDLQGLIFSYDPDNNSYQKEHDFISSSEGGDPQGSFVMADNGWLYGLTYYGGSYGAGTVFCFYPPTKQFLTIHNFSITDGFNLEGSLVLASNGKLYGMSPHGGLYFNGGSLFSIDPTTNSFEVHYNFDPNLSKGYNPSGDLTEGDDGQLYGLAPYGGAYAGGTLFKFDPISNNMTVVHDFLSIIYDGLNPYGSLVKDSLGNFYGMTQAGGNYSHGTIFYFQPQSGIYAQIHSFEYYQSGGTPSSYLCRVNDGWLYGLTAYGGTGQGGTIFRIHPSDYAFETVHNFINNDSMGFFPLGSLMQADNGLLYGMTYESQKTDAGILFSFSASNQAFERILEFNDVEGVYPHANLMMGNDDQLYAVTLSENYYGNFASGDGIIHVNPSNGDFNKLTEYKDPGFYSGDSFSSLVQASDGWLYGTTDVGEIYRYSVILDTIERVYLVNVLADGTNFRSSLLQLSDGWLYGTGINGGDYNDGVIFRFDPDSHQYQKLFDFNGDSNGNEPNGNLIQASDGLLYGLCKNQGPTSGINGILYSFDPVSKAYTKRFEFTDTLNGAVPFGAVIQAGDGYLYGMTSQGGIYGEGTMFRFDITNNQFTKLIDFDGDLVGGRPQGSLFEASNSVLYGMTFRGGLNDKGLIFAYFPLTGDFQVMQNFTVNEKGALPYGGLIEIHLPPGIVYQSHDTIACNETAFEIQVIGSGGYLYHTWYHDGVVVGGNSRSIEFNSISYADSGYYWCVIYNDLGTVTSDSIHITVMDGFSVTISSASDSVCLNGDLVELTGIPSGGIFAGNGVINNNFNPVFSGLGIQNITYTVTAGCSITDTTTIDVLPLSVVSLSFSGSDTLCLNSMPVQLTGVPSGGIFSGNGVSGNLFDPSIAGVGTHVILYTYSDLCTNADSIALTVEICSGMENPSVASISVYPNPFNDFTMVKLGGEMPQSGSSLVLCDQAGRIIHRQSIVSSTTVIDKKDMMPGMYLLRLINKEGLQSAVVKIVVE